MDHNGWPDVLVTQMYTVLLVDQREREDSKDGQWSGAFRPLLPGT